MANNLNEGKRLVTTGTIGDRSYRVYKDTEWSEFVVKFFTGGVHDVNVDYHTDDQTDATDTAKRWLRSAVTEIAADPNYLHAAERSRADAVALQRRYDMSPEVKAAARKTELKRDKGLQGYSQRHRKERPEMYPKPKLQLSKGPSGPQDWYGQNRYMGDGVVYTGDTVTEVFQAGKNWEWDESVTDEHGAIANFEVDGIRYRFMAYGNEPADGGPSTEWVVLFKNLSRPRQGFDRTGDGNSVKVFSVVVDIMRSFLSRYRDIDTLKLAADEKSRRKLYERMVRRLLPTWKLTTHLGSFKVQRPDTVTEMFQSGKNWQWTNNTPNTVGTAEARFEVGGIPYRFRAQKQAHGIWHLAFSNQGPGRSSYGRTRDGNSIEVFSVVVDIMRSLLKTRGQEIEELNFEADADDPARATLYRKMLRRLIPDGWDYSYEWDGEDGGKYTIFPEKADVNEDWQKTNRADKTDGMSQKAVDAYRKEHPGSKLKTAVTKDPSKIKPGSADDKRRDAFCSRMSGAKRARASAETKRDPNSRINLALKRWNCNEGDTAGVYGMALDEMFDDGSETPQPVTDASTMSWIELSSTVSSAAEEMGWKVRPQGESGTMFSIHEREGDDEYRFVGIADVDGNSFEYTVGKISEGHPEIEENEVLPNSEEGIGQLLQVFQVEFNLPDEAVVEMARGVTRGAVEGLKEFAPGSGGGESGRWYTDDQITDLVGDGWYEDMDVSGNIPKQQMIQRAQAWLDDQGYCVQVLNAKSSDDGTDWYIEGNFHNPNFAKKGIAEGVDDEEVPDDVAAMIEKIASGTSSPENKKAAIDAIVAKQKKETTVAETANPSHEERERAMYGTSFPTSDGISWQDVRLMAGEGKLSKKTVSQALAAIRKQRRNN